jgi:hypothetical protein
MDAEDELHRLVAQRIRDLEAALEPFTRHMSSEECITLQIRNEWVQRARALLGPKLHEEVPPWMAGMAHNIAVEYMREGQQRNDMERDIVNAMKEAAREVALHFAANPKKAKEMRDGCEVCGGTRGGVPGNENRIDGKRVCDYCHADMRKEKPNA